MPQRKAKRLQPTRGPKKGKKGPGKRDVTKTLGANPSTRKLLKKMGYTD
jgi:hypothetical protein